MKSELISRYRKLRENILVHVSRDLKGYIESLIQDFIRVDGIYTRAKSVDSFIKKAEQIDNGIVKYKDPINQIQDQIGARIVVNYLSDVKRIKEEFVELYFKHIENKRIVPDSDKEFGYFGEHYILLLPEDVIDGFENEENCPVLFEMQIHTLFQHAWGEANHDLAFKGDKELDSLSKRKVAFTSAQAWGADLIFEELHKGMMN